MMSDVFVGVDVGSVSVDVAVLDASGQVLKAEYLRHRGHPMQQAAAALTAIVEEYGRDHIAGMAATGNGGRVVASLLGIPFINEVVAQAAATARLHPQVRTVIEIGGEDSKLVIMKDLAAGRAVQDVPAHAEAGVADFAMNTMCAAGTGSFLDQQATRLGLSIEEFGALAVTSENPPRVAGRCSVFAKSDMIHLQQKATPVRDIVAGLCYALVRNFKSTVGSATVIQPPVAFNGGVAANAGIVKAMRGVLELSETELIIPEHFGCMGAIGAVYAGVPALGGVPFGAAQGLRQAPALQVQRDKLAELGVYSHLGEKMPLKPLKLDQSVIMPAEMTPPSGVKTPAYLGVDIGSISTNVVVIDADGKVLSKRYLMTAGRPIEAVRQGLSEVGEEVADLVEIKGACTTGSGRYLIADFIGADVVKNEITAQARGALAIDPQVDTIFEIGGQDSKYISLSNGAVVDFEMNKVCAAGTGSFLEEQAEKLGISIKEEFADLAFQSGTPIDLGERCTVFMESELMKHQQSGSPVPDLVAGLAYSIATNYLNRVVARKPVGERIFFQGGTAFNKAVVAAFEAVTGKAITVPAHNEVTGALGCALIAREHDTGADSRFKGFDLTRRNYTVESFECQDCSNHCEINKVTVEGEEPLYYGSRCEKYDVDRRQRAKPTTPDLFRERAQMLVTMGKPEQAARAGGPRVGVPRALLFHEMYPFWHALLAGLGCEIVLSDPTNKKIIHEGAERSVAETCFPMKVALGHVLNLAERKEIDYIWLPSIINLPHKGEETTDSFVCPYVQSLCYSSRSSVDFEQAGIKVLQPVIFMQLGLRHRMDALAEVARELRCSRAQLRKALEAAEAAQEAFEQAKRQRGEEVLAQLAPDQRALVVVSRAYNGCDPGANLEIPRKLREMGELVIPMDFLSLDDVGLPGDWFNMYWGYGHKILAAAELIARDERLHAVYITNFGCGPDSFIGRFFAERLGGKPFLQIEVDEHSADAGMITRCEAYLDSLDATKGREYVGGRTFRPLTIDAANRRTVMVPNMSAHAHGLAAAFESCGMPAEVLPEPDEETLYWGRKYTTGKECFPCIVTTGDMVKYMMRHPEERDRVAFFMGGSGGPCRFGQYNALQRMVLDDLGYEGVPLFAPNQASSFYDEMGIVGRKFLRNGWRGIVAVDMVEKAVLELRPYEKQPGACDAAAAEGVREIRETIATEGKLAATMERIAERFSAIEVDRSQRKPIIGVVGEFYVRANAFSNQNLIRQLESLGAEVWSAPVFEWFLYRNFRRDMRARLGGDWKLVLKNKITDGIMRRDEAELAHALHELLENAEEPSTDDVLDMAAPYVDKSFEGEAIMTVGKAIDFAHKGLAGIVAVMPFTCMPGTVSNAILKRVREDKAGIPFLNMVYDGLEQSTALTRLEAFVHQAGEYARRNAGRLVGTG
ncbi:MAG: CoA activase [Armatimonadetes bacterium]|nr:CoA activase [Armatimonadota bacterium]